MPGITRLASRPIAVLEGAPSRENALALRSVHAALYGGDKFGNLQEINKTGGEIGFGHQSMDDLRRKMDNSGLPPDISDHGNISKRNKP